MSDQYLGEIRNFGFNFAPVGWLQCQGQTLPIALNQALFALLGTTYGGNGGNGSNTLTATPSNGSVGVVFQTSVADPATLIIP